MTYRKSKEQIVKQHAEAWVNEFSDDELDAEWTGTGFAELRSEEQALFGTWRDFHDLIKGAILRQF